MGKKVAILFSILFFSVSLYSSYPWMNPYPLKGRHFKDLSIDLNEFNSGSKYANLNGAFIMVVGENFFHRIGQILDNQCWNGSPGNFCDYNFLQPLLDPGLNVDSNGNSLHTAGGLRTVPYEPRNHRNSACLNDVPSGATCNGDRDIYPNGDSKCFWWVNNNAIDLSSLGYMWIYPNGMWEEHYSMNAGTPPSSAYSINNGSDDTSCNSVGVSDPKDCSIANCEYCSSPQESNGVADKAGHYCYPGDDQAVYVDYTHLYYDPNATYSKFRDAWGTLIPNHKGYTFPYHYYYPNPSPYTDGSTWDGGKISQIGFCPSGSGGCGSYPENSFTLQITVPNVYVEIGVHAAGAEQVGRAEMSSLAADAYIKLFFWDDTSDTSPVPGCDTDGDNNQCNDNINDPDALDADVDVVDVSFSGFDVDTNGNISGVVDTIAKWLKGQIENMIKGSLSKAIKSALASAFPLDMNNLLGNPWNTGTGLLDVGIYPGVDNGSGERVALVKCSDGSTSLKTVNNSYTSDGRWTAPFTGCGFVMPAAIAVEPILFNSDCSRDPDLANPEPTDFFGICTLHNADGSIDEDQQFDMNNGEGADYFGPPLIYKANTPPDKVTPPKLDTLLPLNVVGSNRNSWGEMDVALYDANHNGLPDDGSCSDATFVDANNDGVDDNNPNCMLYSVGLHIHYNFIRQALYSMYASGLLDFSVSATSPIGSSGQSLGIANSFLKPLLNVNTFKSFIPVLGSIAKDNSYVSIRVVPRGTPTALTGYFNYDNSPGSVGAKGTGTYDVATFTPVDIEFWFEDKNGVYRRIMTLRWNILAGFDIEFYKGCHPDDPLAGTARCTDPSNPAYIPGYLMIYSEINNPKLAYSLGITTVQVVESEIDVNTNILKNQFSNLIPMILSTYLQSRIEMRVPRIVLGDTLAQGLTFSIPYIGPEGPSVTGLTKGDYLGIYIDILGNVNLFDLMGTLSLTGAPTSKSIYPETYLRTPGIPPGSTYAYLSAADFKSLGFTRNHVVFRYGGRSDVLPPDQLFYTYRIDGGMWHPPTKKTSVEFNFLPDGKHTFEVAAIHHIGPYQFIDPSPAKIDFVVDTMPPDISFINGTRFTSDDDILLSVNDFASGSDSVEVSWSIDGGKFTEWSEARLIPLAGLKDGTHRIVVRAKDPAGNVSEKGLVFEIKNKSGIFGCSNMSSPFGSIIFIILLLISFVGAKVILKSEK